MREALSWIETWRNKKCIFECDAKLVVDDVHGGTGNSDFDVIIRDCMDILKHYEEVLVVFVHRSANSVVHLLGKAAYSVSDPQ